MQIVFLILYVLVGIVLSVSYCILAGWDYEVFPVAFLLAPAFAVIWFITATMAGVIGFFSNRKKIYFNWRVAFGREDRQATPLSLVFFWIWTTYSLLPIIIHWSAILLDKIGYKTISSFIDKYRYASLPSIFSAVLLSIVILVMITTLGGELKKIWMEKIVRRPT